MEKKYCSKRGKLANDPTIMVRENRNKYKILDGNGRVFIIFQKRTAI